MKYKLLILSLFVCLVGFGQQDYKAYPIVRNDSMFLKFKWTIPQTDSVYIWLDPNTPFPLGIIHYVVDSMRANIYNKFNTFIANNTTSIGRDLINLTTPASNSVPVATSGGSGILRTTSQFKQDLSIENVTNESKATMHNNAAFTGTFTIPSGVITNANLANGAVANLSGTNTGDNAANTTYANDYRAANFVAGTNYQAPLVSGSNIKTVNGTSLLGSTDILTTRKVAQADIAATASATGTTALFTPAVDGFYRIGAYLKITTTGTSPVAGPITITYTSADGSVAQSHVMLLRSVTGTVVTTTVNNSTTTGTVNGDIVIYAKAGVAINFAIAVSGTFGAGRYMAHLICEQL